MQWTATNSAAIQAAAAVIQAVGALLAIGAVFVIDRKAAQRAEASARRAEDLARSTAAQAEAAAADTRMRQAKVVSTMAIRTVSKIGLRAATARDAIRLQLSRIDGAETVDLPSAAELDRSLRIRDDLASLLPSTHILDEAAAFQLVVIESVAADVNELIERVATLLEGQNPVEAVRPMLEILIRNFERLRVLCDAALDALGVPAQEGDAGSA